MSTLTIRIVTPQRIAFEGKTDMVTGPGIDGEFGVLENHTQFLTLNQPGMITLGKESNGDQFVVGKGFAEVSNNVVTFLVDVCIAKEDTEGSLEDALASLQH